MLKGLLWIHDGREAALKPEARVNKPPAAESAAMEQMRLNQAKQT